MAFSSRFSFVRHGATHSERCVRALCQAPHLFLATAAAEAGAVVQRCRRCYLLYHTHARTHALDTRDVIERTQSRDVAFTYRTTTTIIVAFQVQTNITLFLILSL